MKIAIQIYLDVFFLVNFIMDLIVLKITSYLVEDTASIWRHLGASFVGSAWAVAEIILTNYQQDLKRFLGIITYAVVPFFMLMIIMGWSNRKKLLKSILVLYVVTFCLSGICYVGWNHLGFGYAFVSGIIRKEHIIGGIVVLLVIMSLGKILLKIRRKYGSDIYKVQLTIRGSRVQFNGLMDTGNVLTDPYTGRGVHIVRSAVMNRIITGKDYASLHYRLIPYNSVGNESGLLPVIDVDSMEIFESGRRIFNDSAAIGIYDGALSGTSSYDGLLNAAVLRN